MLAILLRWTTTIRYPCSCSYPISLPHSKVALIHTSSVTSHFRPHFCFQGARARLVLWSVGPWKLAQYDPVTGCLLLRQSFQDTGLEPLIRQIWVSVQQPWQDAEKLASRTKRCDRTVPSPKPETHILLPVPSVGCYSRGGYEVNWASFGVRSFLYG
jgi:hypothetical protein